MKYNVLHDITHHFSKVMHKIAITCYQKITALHITCNNLGKCNALPCITITHLHFPMPACHYTCQAHRLYKYSGIITEHEAWFNTNNVY